MVTFDREARFRRETAPEMETGCELGTSASWTSSVPRSGSHPLPLRERVSLGTCAIVWPGIRFLFPSSFTEKQVLGSVQLLRGLRLRLLPWLSRCWCRVFYSLHFFAHTNSCS